MASREKGSVATARWLVAVIGAVTFAFLVETVVTQRLEGSIANRANQIVANAMPSVNLLTQALGDLDLIDFDLDRYAASSDDARPALRSQLLGEEQGVEALVASYAVLPFFAQEPLLFAPVRPQLHDFRESLAALDHNTVHGALIGLHHDLDMVEQSLRGIVEFDAVQGERLGLEIEQIRGQTVGMVALLDGLCVALAVIAAILAVRMLHRSVRAFEAERSAAEKREAELANLAEALGQFSGRVAHDILSPLSSTLLSLEMIARDTADKPLIQQMTGLGIRSIGRVQTLVDGLLAFSQAGGQPEPGVSTEIEPVLAGVTEELRGQATQQAITLEVSSPPGGVIGCSAGVLASLISNLVRNAIRYMGNAVIRRVEVRVLDHGERWRVEVQDTGPGIPADQQGRIFEPHVRLAHGGAGVGLGLATVDRLVRAHGGALGVTSTVGIGSVFWFELPKSAASRQPEHVSELQPALA